MTRWLDAARRASMPPDKTVLTDKTHAEVVSVARDGNPAGVKSVKSVLSAGGIAGGVAKSLATGLPTDAEAYLAFLSADGPATYGAAAVALGWGASRAWRIEAQLRVAGLVRYDCFGKACSVEAQP